MTEPNLGVISNLVPVLGAVALARELAKLKSCTVDGGVVLPDVVVGSRRTGKLGMDSVAKSLLDGGQADTSLEDDQKLPMSVSGVVADLNLTLIYE